MEKGVHGGHSGCVLISLERGICLVRGIRKKKGKINRWNVWMEAVARNFRRSPS